MSIRIETDAVYGHITPEDEKLAKPSSTPFFKKPGSVKKLMWRNWRLKGRDADGGVPAAAAQSVGGEVW